MITPSPMRSSWRSNSSPKTLFFVLMSGLMVFASCKTEPTALGPANTNTNDIAQSAFEDSSETTKDTPCTASEDCGDGYCVKGFCRAWECEDDEDCAESGELARCNQTSFLCVICDAGDANCLGVECATDSQCSDFDTCTEDLCTEDNLCQFDPIDDCCTDDSQCDDGVECTLDRCKQGSCSYVPQDNFCCASNDHCGDGNPCTEDLCLASQCIHPFNTGDPACGCDVYLECDDANPCTQDQCAGGVCAHSPLPPEERASLPDDSASCCAENLDCSDSDSSTFERCYHNQCVGADAAECDQDSECTGSTTCTVASCLFGHCDIQILSEPGCCASSADCSKGEKCSLVSCDDNICTEANSDEPEVLWSEGFDSADGDLTAIGWTLTNDGSGAYWQIADKLYSSYPSCLCFGVSGCTSYEVGKTTSGSVTSPEISLPSDRLPRLSFDIATDVEPGIGGNDPSTQKDWVYVEVLSGGAATKVFDKKDMLPSTDTNLAWVAFEINLEAFKGQTIQLRFGFDSKDSNDNNHQGIFVDEVRVTLDCP